MNRIQYLHYWLWSVKLRNGETRFLFLLCAFLSSLVIFGAISVFTKDEMIMAWLMVSWAIFVALYFVMWCGGQVWAAVQEFNRAYEKHREKTFNILKE